MSTSAVDLPAWAVVTPERVAHVSRVTALLERWAAELEVSLDEQRRWVRAAALHDALRDAPLEDPLRHGPAAADLAAAHGERDRGVLDAVRYHTIGFAGWDQVGRMLYCADYLEPGRGFEAEERTALAARLPAGPDAVLRDVAERRIRWVLRSGWPLLPETVTFWNSLRR